jgi:hypothetical protein
MEINFSQAIDEASMQKLCIPCILSLFLLVACRPADDRSITPQTRRTPSQTIPKISPITLYYEDNAQFEIVSSQAARIYLDIGIPAYILRAPEPQDILLTSAPESHRNEMNFQRAFPGRQLEMAEGPISAPEIFIQGIRSKCRDTDAWGTNYIYRIDLSGMRIAVFGEIGQSRLTDEQINALGAVDIAIMQLTNYDCGMDGTNTYAFNIMEQVQPRLIILTQSDWEAVGLAAQKWTGYATNNSFVKLDRLRVAGPIKFLTLGMMAPTYQKLFNLQVWQ